MGKSKNHEKKNGVWCANVSEVQHAHVNRHPATLHVYGGICWHGIIGLFIIRGNINGQVYQNLLRNRFFPAVFKLYRKSKFIWQQDNAAPHISNTTQRFLDR